MPSKSHLGDPETTPSGRASRDDSPLVRLAAAVAARAHARQHRRDGVTPYITHPEAVALRVRREPAEVIAAAWLHDVLADTQETPASLRAAGLPEIVVEAVIVLTKEGGSYEEYLARVRANPIARKVKVADMLHNLSDEPTQRQILKYAQGLLALLDNP